MPNQSSSVWQRVPKLHDFCVSRIQDGLSYREIAREASGAFQIPVTADQVEEHLSRSGFKYSDYAKPATVRQKAEKLLAFLPLEQRDEVLKLLGGIANLGNEQKDIDTYSVPDEQRSPSRYTAINGRAVYRVVVIGDLHWPFHHEAATRALTRFFEDVHPDLFVMNGDIWDAAALCKYPVQARRENRRMDLGEEMKSSLPLLSRWIEASGETVYTGGNHDIDRKERLLANEARGLPYETNTIWHLWNHYGFPKVKFFESEYKGHFLKIGSGPFAHNVHHGHLYPMHTAAKNVTSELPGESSTQSHTHRPQVFFWRGKVGVVTGHVMDQRKQNYMPSPSWTMGITVIDFFDDGMKSTVTPLQIYEDGSFSYGGQVYTGEEEEVQAKVRANPAKKRTTRKVLEKVIKAKKRAA